MFFLPGYSIPHGNRWNANFLPSTTSVCPALEPPLNRATMSYLCVYVYVRACVSVHMCVCVCVCVCMRDLWAVYTYAGTVIYYTHIRTHARTHIHTQTHTHNMCTHKHTDLFARISTSLPLPSSPHWAPRTAHTCAYVCMCVYVCVCAHIYIRIKSNCY